MNKKLNPFQYNKMSRIHRENEEEENIKTIEICGHDKTDGSTGRCLDCGLNLSHFFNHREPGKYE